MKDKNTVIKFEALPSEIFLTILSFLPDSKSIFNLAITCKKSYQKIKELFQEPNCFDSHYFSPDILILLIRKLDEYKDLKKPINSAKAREEIKKELAILIANRFVNQQNPLQFLHFLPAPAAPLNHDFDNQITHSYQKINDVMSTRLNYSRMSYMSPLAVKKTVSGIFFATFLYLLFRKHLPQNLNISTYLPQNYSLLATCFLLAVCYLGTRFNVPSVIASFYAQKKENDLRNFVNQPLATISPVPPSAKTLARYRNNLHETLKKKDVEKSKDIDDLPLETNQYLGGIKKIS